MPSNARLWGPPNATLREHLAVNESGLPSSSSRQLLPEGTIMPSEQKVVVITGASKGIGARLMKGFRESGYGVVVNARSIEKIDGADDPAAVAVEGATRFASTT